MQTIKQNQPQGGMGVQDILFILFKHKWKILLFTLLGFGAAALVKTRSKPVYESTAKLLVSYIVDREMEDSYEAHRDASGRNATPVIMTEMTIITSQDLALIVAERVGPEKLLPSFGEEATVVDGAISIQNGLNVSAESGVNVLEVSYQHADPELSKEVLRELIAQYFELHLSIHRSGDQFDVVSEKIDQQRSQMRKTIDELAELRALAEEISLADSTASLQVQRVSTRGDLMRAEAELAEQQARIDFINERLPVPEGDEEVGEEGLGLQPGAGEIAKYQALLERLTLLEQAKLELLIKYTPQNRLVTLSQERINEVEAQRKALARKFPSLVTKVGVLNGQDENAGPDPEAEKQRYRAISARIAVLNSQMKELEGKYSQLSAVEAKMARLEERKTMETEKYRSLEVSLLQAQSDEALEPAKGIPNIDWVQHPSAPVKTYDEQTKKIVLGLAGSGLVLGIGLALLLELLIDRRISRPVEIETRMHIPLMLSIPRLRLNGATRLLPAPRGGLPMKEESGEIILPDVPAAEADMPIEREDHFIRPYADAIRDRLFYYFELNDMTHKPKLVAVTGISEGAGTSTVASGLASAFADVEDAKVLLVDMNMNHDAANPIFETKHSYSLLGALKAGRGVEFQESRENLFLATGTLSEDSKGPRSLAPRKLFDLMPVLRASEYDYIIFDMPPTGPTSPTLAMAGFMDQVLLVLDAQNTNRDELKRTHSELVQGKAEVSCIFNKTRSHAPRWVEGAV